MAWVQRALSKLQAAVRSELYRVDLRRTYMGGECGIHVGAWAQITGDPQRLSRLLKDSPHVKFLEQYLEMGEAVLEWKNFESTDYYRNALQCIRYGGSYFGHRSGEGVLAQARSFVELYNKIRTGDPTEVVFRPPFDHERPGTPVQVRRRLEPSIFEVKSGQHRLAIAWVLGRRKVLAEVLPPWPTEARPPVLASRQVMEPAHSSGDPQVE